MKKETFTEKLIKRTYGISGPLTDTNGVRPIVSVTKSLSSSFI